MEGDLEEFLSPSFLEKGRDMDNRPIGFRFRVGADCCPRIAVSFLTKMSSILENSARATYGPS